MTVLSWMGAAKTNVEMEQASTGPAWEKLSRPYKALTQHMQKATAASGSATPALAAAQQALRHVEIVDSSAGHNKSGAGMLQAEHGKDELQESKGQQAAQEPQKSPLRAEAARRAQNTP